MRTTLLCAAAALLATAGPAAAQDHAQNWTTENLGPEEGLRLTHASQPGVIRIIDEAGIEAACSCVLDEQAETRVERIQYGLSTLWIDAGDMAALDLNGTVHLAGEAYTEHGERQAVAGFYADGLRVYLAEGDALDVDTAARILATATSGPAAAPAQTAPTTTAPEPAATKPAAPSGRTVSPQAESLLARITAGIEAPGKARADAAAQARAKARADLVANAPMSGGYPGPVIFEDSGRPFIANWTREGDAHVARAGDARAPRLANYAVINVARFGGTAADMTRELSKQGLSRARMEPMEEIDINRSILGNPAWISAGTARRAGRAVRVFAFYQHNPKTGQLNVYVYDAPPAQWRDWGGMAVPFARIGVHQQQDFEAPALAQLRAMDPAEEVAIFEEHYTARVRALASGTLAAQAATLNSLRNFNMASATCAGMDNCDVVGDGLGGYEAQVEP